MQFSKRVNISPSATLEINSLALKKKKAGEKVFNLSAGEAFINTSKYIEEAGILAITENKTYYTPTLGINELRTASYNWINKKYGAQYSLEETFITNGGKFALFILCQSLLNPGDEAIVLAPYWVSYTSMIELAGGNPIILKTQKENNWKIDPEEIRKAITDKTRFLILNNASNPTGVLYSREEIRIILKIAQEKNILVISDEVYSELVYDGQKYISCSSFLEYKNNVIVVHSASKIFSMTGWRVGFVFAQSEIIQVLNRVQGQSTSNTSSISQWATVEAFEHADEIISEIKIELQNRRDVFVKTFNDLFSSNIVVPSSALYCFIPMKDFGVIQNNSVEFCKEVLEKSNVAMVPGAPFGTEGYIRCSFGVISNEICEALNVLHKFLKR